MQQLTSKWVLIIPIPSAIALSRWCPASVHSSPQPACRFLKTSSKVVDKMASNATQIVQTFKDALDKLQDGGKGGG